MWSLTWLSPRSCPGEQLVDVSFRTTPEQPSLHIFWSDLTGYAFAAFAFSFLFVSLALGIFRHGAALSKQCQPAHVGTSSAASTWVLVQEAREGGKAYIAWQSLRLALHMVTFLMDPCTLYTHVRTDGA